MLLALRAYYGPYGWRISHREVGPQNFLGCRWLSDSVALDLLVVLLGHENSRNGELSPNALSRISVAENLIKCSSAEKSVALVATGGFGGHFNKSNHPHGRLLIQELERRGIEGVRVLSHVHSCGTLEDALGVFGLVRRMSSKPTQIIVVTSKYHKPRAEFVFTRLFPFFELSFETDEDSGAISQKKHEIRSLKVLSDTLPNISTLCESLDEPMNQLSEELRHYDNLSYLALAASFLTIYAWFNMFLSMSGVLIEFASIMIMASISGIFFIIYYRLAGTAASARRTISAVSFVSGRPHVGSSMNTASRRSLKIVTAAALSLAVAWLGAILFAYCSLGSRIPFLEHVHSTVCG